MKITEITENINFYDRFGHDTGAQPLPYTVEVRDRETGGKKLISIQAVSAADARERARDRGYRVVRVVSQDESPSRRNMREHDGRDDEPEDSDQLWIVSFTDGEDIIKVRASSKQEAIRRATVIAKSQGNPYPSVDWAKPKEQGVAEGSQSRNRK